MKVILDTNILISVILKNRIHEEVVLSIIAKLYHLYDALCKNLLGFKRLEGLVSKNDVLLLYHQSRVSMVS